MSISVTSIVKAIFFFFILLVTSPIVLVVYIVRRWTGRYDDNSLSNVLTKIYGWPTEISKTHSETAWLNGLRGFAAAMVMFHHLNGDLLGLPTTRAPFGATLHREFHYGGYINYHAGHQFLEFWRLPILRLFVISGDAQVAIFFVLSGFVLSWSPLKMIYSDKPDNFSSYLGSLMFRRWFRLYLPCFFVATLYLIGDFIKHGNMRSSIGQFFWEIWNFLTRTEEWQRPFYVDDWKVLKVSNIAMWTIPWEYAGSVYLVVVLLCVGRFQDPFVRMFSIAALSIYAACIMWWVYALFGFGIVLCDYILYHGSFDSLSNSQSALSRIMWTVVGLIGIYCLGFTPPQSDGVFDIPGYRWMCLGTTSWLLIRYWTGVGAILFVTSACHLASIRRLFDTTLFQYLGRISFMLYLIHNFIIQHVTLNIRNILLAILVPWQFDEEFKAQIYKTTSVTLVVIWGVCTLYTTVLTFIAANWLEILVDQPCTRFSRKADKVLTSGVLLERIKARSTPLANARDEEESLPLYHQPMVSVQ